MLLKDQIHASPFRGLPVEDNSGLTVLTVTGETVQFYYSNAGSRTVDAGQAAGVAVEAVFARSEIRNKQGKLQGSKIDSSLSFTSTAFTTEVAIDLDKLEMLDTATWAQRLATITENLNNGEYVVDYSKGIAYGKKASIQTTLTSAAYNVEIPSTAINFELPAATIRSSAYEASHVISAAAATLKELRGFNSGAAQWIQIHDASSLPANTAVPEEIIYVGSNQNFSFTPPAGLSFTTGIVVCNSSTGPTKTIGAADCWFSADID